MSGRSTLPKGYFSLKDYSRLEKPEVRWLVEELLLAGGTSVLAAKAKTGKSVLVRQLAVAVAQGKDFLGRKTVQGGVIYAGLEDNAQMSAEHFAKLGATDDDPIVIFDRSTPASPDMLRQALEATPGTVLVIVDTLFRMYPVQSADDYMQVTRSMDSLVALSKQYGVHVACLHHMGKRERSDMQDGILGSTAIGASVETIMMMPIKGKQRSIETRQRYGHDMEETKLIYDPVTQSSALATPVQSGLLDPPAETLFARTQREICAFLDTNPGATEPMVMSAVQGGQALKTSMLRQMTNGLVRREGAGCKGDPFRYFAAVIPVEGSLVH